MEITHDNQGVNLAELIGRQIRVTKASGVWTGRLEAAQVNDSPPDGASWNLQLETEGGATSFTALTSDGPWTITVADGNCPDCGANESEPCSYACSSQLQEQAAELDPPTGTRPSQPLTPPVPPVEGDRL